MCVCVCGKRIPREDNLPISGANRHEFPINGRPFGPGTSEYGRICAECFTTLSFSMILSDVVAALLFATSLGNILIADENVVRFTNAFVAVRVPILQYTQNLIPPNSDQYLISKCFCFVSTSKSQLIFVVSRSPVECH